MKRKKKKRKDKNNDNNWFVCEIHMRKKLINVRDMKENEYFNT